MFLLDWNDFSSASRYAVLVRLHSSASSRGWGLSDRTEEEKDGVLHPD